MGLNSCLYECSVMHHRLAPKEHHFSHNIFMFYLDLDEVDHIARKTLLFSHNRFNFYTFRDTDHLPATSQERSLQAAEMCEPLAPCSKSCGVENQSEHATRNTQHASVGSLPGSKIATPKSAIRNPQSTIKQRLLAYLASHNIPFDPRGRVMLLTLPRVLGYIFNPVSFYYCFDPAGAPVCSIAEVGNTFREMKLFLLGPEELTSPDSFRKLTPKHFYVSPFSSLDLSFDFKLRIPGDALEIHIDDRDGDGRVLLSTLSGQRAALTDRRLAWFSLKYPLVTLKVIFLIHWHALLLYLKKIPFYRKTANPARQSGVLNPHATLTGRVK